MLEDAFRREFCRPPDQTLLALARDNRVGRLLVADGWRSFAASAARRRPARLVDRATIAGREIVRVRPHRWRRKHPTEVRAIAKSYRAYGELLGKALARSRGGSEAGARSATLVTYDPFAAAHCVAPWIAKVVYFGQDDWATGEGVRPWWDAYVDAYGRIDERGATIFVVSKELADRVSARARVIPNGVDPDVWSPRRSAPPRISDLQRPRAVYSGTIDGRLDRELVELTANAVGSLVMIGHFGDESVVNWLRSIANVHVFGTVGQAELAATVQACDLGVIPHRDQAGIRAMSPLKLYEYLAAGLPVVAVDLPPLRGVADDRVRLCPPGEWARGVSDVLAMTLAPDDERLRFIASVAWANRMKPVVEEAVRLPLAFASDAG